MRKKLIVILMLFASFVSAEEIELSIGGNSLNVESVYPRIYLTFNEKDPIGLNEREASILLNNINLVEQTFQFIEENSIGVNHSKVVKTMYVNDNRLMLRVHVKEDRQPSCSISFIAIDELYRMFFTREEIQSLAEQIKNKEQELLSLKEQRRAINEFVLNIN